jgi:ribonuclease P protein component
MRRRAPRPHLVAARAFEEAMREEDIPTEQPAAEQEARIPPADEHKSRSQRSAQPPRQGPFTPVGLIWPIRERSTFRALARGRRRRRGVVMVTCAVVGPGSEPPRVAYAIGRGVGGAVVRNRVRRRLRAATRVHASELVPGRAYLVGASPAAATLTYDELSSALSETLRALREDSP